MNIVNVTPPASEPVTLAEVLQHCRISTNEDNDYVRSLIQAAREYVETSTSVIMIETTLRQSFDDFPRNGPLRLMRSPLLEVGSVKYFDYAGVEQTLDPAEYVVDADSRPPRIAAWPSCWPTADCGRPNAVTVTFTAGHANAAAVPAQLKAAIKFLVAHWYEMRQPVVIGTISTDIPLTVTSLLRLNRVRGIF
jgi:uncharacterized phiE125 gp8 family phage protein